MKMPPEAQKSESKVSKPKSRSQSQTRRVRVPYDYSKKAGAKLCIITGTVFQLTLIACAMYFIFSILYAKKALPSFFNFLG